MIPDRFILFAAQCEPKMRQQGPFTQFMQWRMMVCDTHGERSTNKPPENKGRIVALWKSCKQADLDKITRSAWRRKQTPLPRELHVARFSENSRFAFSVLFTSEAERSIFFFGFLGALSWFPGLPASFPRAQKLHLQNFDFKENFQHKT